MAPNRIIIDTDPGCDDVLAMLLALSSSPSELEVAMISVTYGNVPLQSCLKNTVAIFHVLEKEMAWRETNGKKLNFENLRTQKPIVAVGPQHPLEDDELMADYFHGLDGLHGVHEQHPQLSPAENWEAMFHRESPELDHDPSPYSKYLTASKEPAHKEILRLLRESPEDTITIAAVGPMTNLAMAAAEDPETFVRAKEIVVMGGAINVEGNVTPVAEFNTYADAVATARVFALSSHEPKSTMPPISESKSKLPAYPAKVSRRLKVTLMPLDITTPHLLGKNLFNDFLKPLLAAGSPLATWVNHFMTGVFNKVEAMEGDANEPALSLHDPLTIWYALTSNDPAWKAAPKPEDIRIETSGQWTRGMHVIDRRSRVKPGEEAVELAVAKGDDVDALIVDEVPGDDMGWLSAKKGNRVKRITGSPGEKEFAEYLMKRVFAE